MLLVDVITGLPDSVATGEEEGFFVAVYKELSGALGHANMLGGFVHDRNALGEPTHMHAPLAPMADGRFAFGRLCPRAFYTGLSRRLSDVASRALGHRVTVTHERELVALRRDGGVRDRIVTLYPQIANGSHDGDRIDFAMVDRMLRDEADSD
ncbi:hypothetical protein [Paratractidigestivibacter sp.]|uniref:hypothetical protein n=1 Tax=Paratractidigestivibacter sp. TaxID=2847316 RepID=UPI002AC95EDC|nr:hypothetical protein [Paratractidigestivibacter sp.]